MPRLARRNSKTGIYHVMIRGNNPQTMFKDYEEFVKIIDELPKSKEKSEFDL